MKRCCKNCKSVKPLDEFQKLETGHKFICIPCYKEQVISKAEKAGKTVKEYEKWLLKERQKYKQKKAKPFYREIWLKRLYNIDLSTYNALLIKQGGVCAICSKPETRCKTKYLSVDHCHKTGKIRGLLCGKCNSVLGYVEDDPTRLVKAIDYLSGNAV